MRSKVHQAGLSCTANPGLQCFLKTHFSKMGNRRNCQQKRIIKNKEGRYDNMIYNLKIKIY